MSTTIPSTRVDAERLEVASRPLVPAQKVSGPPALDIVIPVYNEEHDLEASVRRLHEFLVMQMPYTFRITIADNASTDGTRAIADHLAASMPLVRSVHLPLKGRGRALNQVWGASDAQVLAYMDVDLSTDLAALLPLVAPLMSGHSDVAIGSRLSRGSNVVRGTKREAISRTYNLLLRATLSTGFSDAQCGFKAVRADRARELLPLIEDDGWFFDTELLVLAERAGWRIHEVPVDWIDDPDSRVDIVSTAVADLKGIARLMRGFSTGRIRLDGLQSTAAKADVPVSFVRQVMSFAGIGVVSTLAYMALFVLLRGPFDAQAANAFALLITAIGNTAANRFFTFGIRGSDRRLTHQFQGLIVFALGLCLTAGSLALLTTFAPSASRTTELIVLTVANLAATVLRFVLLRAWVFSRRAASTAAPAKEAVS